MPRPESHTRLTGALQETAQETLQEAARVLTVCNACRYCEGHCAVFPAMTRRLEFKQPDIHLLANLCHQCGACYHHCQYAEPHEFNINVPRVLEQARHLSWQEDCRPRFTRFALHHSAAFASASFLIFSLLLTAGVALSSGPAALFTPAPAGFYAVIPHQAMVTLFGALALLILWAWAASLSRFWRRVSLPSPWQVPLRVYAAALGAALTLKNLDGGHGKGCYTPGSRPNHLKRLSHHLVMYGFLACFAATCLGTVYHYLLNQPAPYPWPSPPKVLGVIGGLALTPGLLGLLWLKWRTDPRLVSPSQAQSGYTLILLLLLVTVSGLLLPLFSTSALLPLTLCLHLAAVAALFLNFAWGKFIHGLYRLVALIANENEQRAA